MASAICHTLVIRAEGRNGDADGSLRARQSRVGHNQFARARSWRRTQAGDQACPIIACARLSGRMSSRKAALALLAAVRAVSPSSAAAAEPVSPGAVRMMTFNILSAQRGLDKVA